MLEPICHCICLRTNYSCPLRNKYEISEAHLAHLPSPRFNYRIDITLDKFRGNFLGISPFEFNLINFFLIIVSKFFSSFLKQILTNVIQRAQNFASIIVEQKFSNQILFQVILLLINFSCLTSRFSVFTRSSDIEDIKSRSLLGHEYVLIKVIRRICLTIGHFSSPKFVITPVFNLCRLSCTQL